MTEELKQKAEKFLDLKTKEWIDGAYDFTLEEVRIMLIEFATEATKELQEQIAELKIDYESLNLLFEQDETEIRQLKGKLSMCGGTLR